MRRIGIRILFFLALVNTISSCTNDVKVVNKLTSVKDLPLVSSKNLQILRSDSGRLQAKLNCPVLNIYEGEEPFKDLPEGFDAEIYNGSEEVETVISANKGKLFNNDMLMDAKDDVVVINSQGEKLNTEHLIWDGEKKIIYTEEFVKITTEEEVIFGEGLEANESFTKYTIKKPRGSITLEDD
ncbi:MAG: LPS export ABC transporter periplasmic protein LptC [Flavobacteriales bacterium]|nr:LPS export ABC transporter periplasmic protein LptC [Flavobacteriales bacterium]